jgi:Domain of unknown function (DUF4326)
MTKPQRIQLRRTKGWRLQEVSQALNGLPAIVCTRSGEYGNPFVIGMHGDRYDVSRLYYEYVIQRRALGHDFLQELRGHNLACWCPLDQPCHADVLLEWSNGEALKT